MMNLWPFRKRRTPTRYIVATGRDNRAARIRKEETTAALKAFVASHRGRG